jgi:hypothetical protein
LSFLTPHRAVTVTEEKKVTEEKTVEQKVTEEKTVELKATEIQTLVESAAVRSRVGNKILESTANSSRSR